MPHLASPISHHDESSSVSSTFDAVFDRVRAHIFHPIDETSFTVDRALNQHGIADLDDEDWLVRLLAIRDLVRGGDDAINSIRAGLQDDDVQVRYICATVLGVLRSTAAIDDLVHVVRYDPDPLARSAATIALGRIGSTESLDLLQHCRRIDESKDDRH